MPVQSTARVGQQQQDNQRGWGMGRKMNTLGREMKTVVPRVLPRRACFPLGVQAMCPGPPRAQAVWLAVMFTAVAR